MPVIAPVVMPVDVSMPVVVAMPGVVAMPVVMPVGMPVGPMLVVVGSVVVAARRRGVAMHDGFIIRDRRPIRHTRRANMSS